MILFSYIIISSWGSCEKCLPVTTHLHSSVSDGRKQSSVKINPFALGKWGFLCDAVIQLSYIIISSWGSCEKCLLVTTHLHSSVSDGRKQSSVKINPFALGKWGFLCDAVILFSYIIISSWGSCEKCLPVTTHLHSPVSDGRKQSSVKINPFALGKWGFLCDAVIPFSYIIISSWGSCEKCLPVAAYLRSSVGVGRKQSSVKINSSCPIPHHTTQVLWVWGDR